MIYADMHKTETNCDELIKTTAAALNRAAVKLLSISVLRNRTELCIEREIKR
jgi:hypothetical protein